MVLSGFLLKTVTLQILLTIILVCGLTFVDGASLELAEASTPVNGIITADTTWTKANSPYSLTGPVRVNDGITLTIEAGVTVNLNSHYIQVDGTLMARGTSTEKIQINGINGFSPLSSSLAIASSPAGITFNDYNRIGAGSIIENAIINSTSIALGNSDKINACTIIGSVGTGQSSIISNSQVIGQIDTGGTSQILNNNISGKIQALGGSSVISNNVITANGISFESTDNIVISGNTISQCNVAIQGRDYATITNNLIINNGVGILFGYLGGVVEENTIAQNQIGIKQNTLSVPTLTIIYNNFENNPFNYYLAGQGFDIEVPQNWWGTTNETTISQTIYDNKNDFNLGTVTFVPFLTTPSSEAPAIPTPSPTPTPNASSLPSQKPTATPNQSGYNNAAFFGLDWGEIAIIALLGVIAVLPSHRGCVSV